jgi:hypothetical protein
MKHIDTLRLPRHPIARAETATGPVEGYRARRSARLAAICRYWGGRRPSAFSRAA